jgi:hypothetical protein
VASAEKVLAFIKDNGLSYKTNSRSFIFTCPRCRKKEKLFMERTNGRFICFHCAGDGYRGRPEFALADLSLQPLKVVREFLYGVTLSATDDNYLDFQLPDFFGDGDAVDEDVAVIESVTWPWDYYEIDHPFSARGAEYLAGRGIPLELAKEYGLRYAPSDRRVIFPIELGSRLVGWQSRLVIPAEYWNEEKQDIVRAPKMLSSKGIPSAHTVMFANRIVNSKHVVVCEGPIDAIKAHACGGNVATMGKAVGSGQVRAIRRPDLLTRQDVGTFTNAGIERVYLALDPDAATETTRLVREFSDLEVYQMLPPTGYKDLGEMSVDAVRDLFQHARRVSSANIFVHFDWK